MDKIIDLYLNELNITKTDKKFALRTGFGVSAGLYANTSSLRFVRTLAKIGIAANILALGLHIYQRYHSEHIKAKCTKLDPEAEKKCKNQIKINAYNKQITYLQANIGKCDRSKNRQSCRNQVMKQINKAKSRIQTLKRG